MAAILFFPCARAQRILVVVFDWLNCWFCRRDMLHNCTHESLQRFVPATSPMKFSKLNFVRHVAGAIYPLNWQIWPEMQVNKMHALYDKHHKVSSFLKRHQNTNVSVKYQVIWKWHFVMLTHEEHWISCMSGRKCVSGHLETVSFKQHNSMFYTLNQQASVLVYISHCDAQSQISRNKASLHRLYAKDFNKSKKTFTNLPNICISGQNYKQIKDKQTKDKDSVSQFYFKTSEWQRGLGIKTNNLAYSLFTFKFAQGKHHTGHGLTTTISVN